ncbi:hypothetical protein C0J52_12933 [Blattella germanica]|nr:hypothetical protein C0J52_12933 [Blattella germanica]
MSTEQLVLIIIIIIIIINHKLLVNRHVARMGDERAVRRILEGKPEGKRSVGRPRMKWENNINHDLREVDYTGDDWKTLAQDRGVWRAYVRTAMNLRLVTYVRTAMNLRVR